MSFSVSNKILYYRNKKSITQEDLAKILGVSRQTIISIEKNNDIPSLPLALKFSRFFKQPIEKLFKLEK